MSEEATSTASVIESAMAEAGGSSAAPEATSETNEPNESANAPDDSEEAEIASLQQELVKQNPKISGQMDVSRHQAVLTRARNKFEAELKAREERLQKLTWAESQEAQAIYKGFQLADSDPAAFVRLLRNDPRFAALIPEHVKEAAKEAVKDGKPKPNAKTPDGSYEYYDDAGLESLLDWHSKQAETRVLEAIEKKYGPLAHQHETTAAMNAALQRGRAKIENARKNWPGYADNEPAIRAEYLKHQNDEGYSVEDAYRAVVIGALDTKAKTSKEAYRKEFLAEMDAKAKAGRTDKPGSSVERTASDSGESRSTADIIREAMRKAG